MNILYENRNIPKELNQYIENNTNIHKYFEQNFQGIKPKNYCGFLNINNQAYFIAPKILNDDNKNLDIFIYMLIYAYDIKLSNEDISNLSNHKHKIFKVFIRFFTDKLVSELKKGLYKKYITKNENLKVLKGKYLIEKNFSNVYHQNIYCEFDEFSMDNELNQLFLFAIKTFKKHSNYSNLYKCEAILDEVEYKNIDLKKLNIHFDRMNKRYKYSFEIAIMILNKIIPMPNSSDKNSFAFLFDMAEVFEKFIANVYKSIDSSTQTQVQKNFGNLQLKPDIIFKNTIIDTKYKKVKNKDDLSTQDKYQMFVYGTNFEMRDTMLLYPKHIYNIKEDLKLGRDQQMIELKMRSIDLDSDLKFDEYIAEIKNRLEGIR
jgi:5-methylcytosine-specific restriction enzyme subunit McrC